MVYPLVFKPVDIPYPNPPDGVGSLFVRKARTSQRPPFNKPAPYDFRKVRTIAAKKKTGSTFGGMANAGATRGPYLVQPDFNNIDVLKSYIQDAVHKARNALVGTLNEQALLATNFVERAKAAEMMGNRLYQLAQFARHIRRGDINSALWAVRGTERTQYTRPRQKSGRAGYVPKYVSSKKAAGLWLEYHFGWEPLVEDVYRSMKILSEPTTYGSVNTQRLDYPPGRVYFDETSETSWVSGGYRMEQTRAIKGWVKAKAGMEFYVTDPNLYLLNRLGLVNPAAVAWEAVPFSFVVDWFVTTGEFINQYSDFAGITVTDPWYSWTAEATDSFQSKETHQASGVVAQDISISLEGFNSRRILGLPEVVLKPKPLKAPSLIRAATAISLLIQFLPSRAKL